MLTIVPSRLAADRLLDRRLNTATEPPGGAIRSRATWAHDVTTLREIVARGVAHHSSPKTPLSTTAATAVVEAVITDLEPEVRSLFGPGLDSPGATAAIARAINFLRHAGLTGLDVARVCEDHRRLRALACVLEAYERRLKRHHVWDDTDQLAAVTDLVQRQAWIPPGCGPLAIEGLYDVTRAQAGLLRALTRVAGDTRVEVPFDPHHESLCTYAFPYLKMWEAIDDPALGIEVSFLDAGTPPAPRIARHPARDPADEARYVAEWIRHHLEAGVPCSEVAIVNAGGVRTLALVTRELERLGVPFHSRRASRLAESPFFGALLLPFRIMEERFERPLLEAWVSSTRTGFDPRLLRPGLRSGPMVSTGHEPWKRSLVGIEGKSAAALNITLERIQRLADVEHAPEAFWSEYEFVLEAAGVIGGPDVAADDLEQWESVYDDLRSSLETIDCWRRPAVGWRTHRRHLAAALSDRQRTLGAPGRGCMIATPHDARGIEMRCVAIVGLGEGAFTRPDPMRGIFGDAERSRLNDALGKRLFRTSSDEAHEGTLLLLERIRRSTAEVLMSHPRQDEDGNPLLPSHAVDAICSALDVEVIDTSRAPERAWRLRPASEVVRAQQIERARADFFARPIGDRRGQGDRYNGAVRDPASDAFPDPVTAARLGEWSASRLEMWRQCGHQYFMRYLLGLETPTRQPLEAEAATLGTLAHEALRALYQANEGRHPEIDAVSDAVREAARNLSPAERGDDHVWPLLVNRVETEIRRYLSLTHPDETRFPAAFEVAFGSREDELPPLSVETRFGAARLSGRIDRIDRDPVTGAIHIVDYKFSRLRPDHKKAVDPEACGVTRFQLWVYALGAFAWGIRAGHAAPPETTASIHGIRRPAVLGELVIPERVVIERSIAGAIEEAFAGRYDPSPTDPEPCRWCDFRTTCRIASGVAPEPISSDDDMPEEA